MEWKPPLGWYIFLGISLSFLGLFGFSIGWLFWEGTGIWGNNIPVAWAWPIVNFVFWVGIGHAGTLISAVLFLFRQKWRTSINRAAEAMTIFAVMCALVFPGIHVGRPWLPYWMFPLPNQMEHVAAVPQPADVGRVRGLDLRHGVAAVLVHRADPGSRHRPRPRQDQDPPDRLRHSSLSAGAARSGNGCTTRRPT